VTVNAIAPALVEDTGVLPGSPAMRDAGCRITRAQPRRRILLVEGQRIGSTEEGPMPGQIVHFEIPADDTAASREFWGSLFGWTFESFPGPFEYHMTQITPDQTGGAISNMEPGKRGTRAYFDVDDVNAGAARVKELGGEANDPMPVPGMGWFSTCRDPHGNEFGLWQNDTSAPTPSQ
jgi:uncharacterized protein